MLAWATTKRVPRDILHHNLQSKSSGSSLLLPRLCHLQPRYLQSRQSSNSNFNSSKKKNAGQSQDIRRNYSTATPPFAAPLAEAHASISSKCLQYPFSHPPTFRGITPVDPTNVIILGTPELHDHIPKNKDETLALFSVCLNSGHLVRANSMLLTMSTILDKDSPALINAINLFLQALIERAEKPNDLKVFFMWYEDNMKAQLGISGNAMTFALLLKASLKCEPKTGQVYLNEYVNQWRRTGSGIGDVLVDPVLTNEEVVKIAKICHLKVTELHESHRALFSTTLTDRNLPEIKSVPSRGHGLAAIQQSIRSLVDPVFMPEAFSISGQDNIALQIERQRLLEEDAWESAQERWKKDHETMCARGVLAVNPSLNSLLWEWHQSFVPLINEELARVRAAEKDEPGASIGSTERCLYGPFLRLLPPDKVAAIVMVELLKVHNSSAGALKTSRAVMHVGNMLEAEYLAQEIQDKDNKELFAHVRNKENLGEIFQNDKVMWSKLIKEARENAPEVIRAERKILPEWPVKIKAKLGAVLLTMLLHCAKAPVGKQNANGEKIELALPAFCHTYRYVKGKKIGLITLDSHLLKRLGTEDLRQGFLGRLLPMVVVPREWRSWNEGGYYYTQSKAVRTKTSREQSEYVRIASERGDLKDLFASLDVLGKTAWRINKRVFDVVIEVWNSEEEFGTIPPAAKETVLPPEPPPNQNPKVRYEWLQSIRIMQTKAMNDHSKRCSVNFKVEIARAFMFDKFYFPHNVDFRGRAYPIPPNLNHIGDDLSRGLLQFDIGKELGESGLRWVKIHLANLCGFDKASFDDRAKFADENMANIIDSANNPLTGEKWWLKAEDPWQTLATCFVLNDALAMEDPTKYVCHIPVAQDGTCNGLQHYAALGGDMMGAAQVNLLPAEKPSDVYTGVAELVRASVVRDAENGNEMAQILQDKITRKVVKQTVMTNVYGVTFIGARDQIEHQLMDIEALAEYRFGHPKFSVAIMAVYLANKVFDSISTMFFGASQIQHWLGACAKRISLSVSPHQMDQSFQDEVETTVEAAPEKKKNVSKKKVEAEGDVEGDVKGDMEAIGVASPRKKKDIHFMTSVVWTTPLRLPVVQPYRHDKVQLVVTNLQNVYITDPSVIDEINARKQMMAFPPNFIHSLDATHMLMSAKKCYDEGLTFASVHDSFWTHPSDVDTLNRILREAFIDLHSGEVMKHLKSEFEVRYEGYKYLASMHPDSPISAAVKELREEYCKNVLKKRGSGKKATLTMLEDLQWERRRDQLLKSENEEERNIGMAMITPSVLVEQMGGLEALTEEQPEEVKQEHPEGSDHDLEADILSPTLGDGEIYIPDAPQATIFAAEHEETAKESPKKKAPAPIYTRVWMPLVFPELPPKGDFKVEDLKQSQYFFS